MAMNREEPKALLEQAGTEVTLGTLVIEKVLEDGRVEDHEIEQVFEALDILRSGTAKVEKAVITQAKTRHEERYGYDAPMPEHIRRRVAEYERNQARDLCKGKERAASVLPKAA